MARSRLLIASFLAVAAACGSFRAEPGPKVEAGASDGGADGGAVESGVVADADAAPACSGDLCDSFERVDVTEGWTPRLEGDAVVTTGEGHDSGRSFRSEARAVDAGARTRRALLSKVFSDVSYLTCAFWMRVEVANTDSDYLKVICQRAGDVISDVWVDSMVDGTQLNPNYDKLPLIGKSWERVSFTLDTKRLQLFYGKSLVGTQQLNVEGPFPAVEVVLGVYTDERGEAIIEYDDIVCSTHL